MLKTCRISSSLALGILISWGCAVTDSFAADKPADLPLAELRTFTEVFARIKSAYIENVDDKKLLEDAIHGMLAGLDPHSSYMSASEYRELQVSTTGEFGGLGIEVTLQDGYVKVIAPMDGTPAQKAGIKPGDLIIRIDGSPSKDTPLDTIIDRMRGKPGTSIELSILREGSDVPLTFNIKRDIIRVESVKNHFLQDGYGYIRISNFQSRTAESLYAAIASLRKEHPLKGLVLDLRNNPGGILDAAVAVADAFLQQGLIVYHEGRTQDANHRYEASPGDETDGAPLVILVNSGSASASEIVAGALQDHKRGVVLGTRSFGKGSVQTIQEMRDGSAIKLTTARYYTPNGRSIQAEGIVPDIELDSLKFNAVTRSQNKPLKEADLAGHLANPKTATTDKKPDAKSSNESLLQSDYELFEALNLLKGLTIMRASLPNPEQPTTPP